MIISYTANTPAEAWRYVLKQFPKHSFIVKGVRDAEDTKAIDGVIITEIKNPTDLVEKNPMYQQGFINAYKEQFVNPDKGGHEYRYGERLFAYPDREEYFGMNQIDYIIRTLQKDKTSRRAVAITWNPYIDTWEDVKDVPCLQLIKCKIVNYRLHMEVVFRSHDMLSAYYPNVLGLSYLMDYIAERIGLPKGRLTVVSLNPHVYHNRDRDKFKQVTGMRI